MLSEQLQKLSQIIIFEEHMFSVTNIPEYIKKYIKCHIISNEFLIDFSFCSWDSIFSSEESYLD
jgi:flagellar biosynthesis protein FlhB